MTWTFPLTLPLGRLAGLIKNQRKTINRQQSQFLMLVKAHLMVLVRPEPAVSYGAKVRAILPLTARKFQLTCRAMSTWMLEQLGQGADRRPPNEVPWETLNQKLCSNPAPLYS